LVTCQGSCAGPTAVVVVVDGELDWFERLQSGKERAGIVGLASGELTEVLARLEKRALSGKRRRKAAKRLRVVSSASC